MSQSFDVIEIKLPPKAEYVGVVRLTLSGIANRMGFSYSDIEDIKIAVSEAITNTVQHAYKEAAGNLTLKFHIFEEKLEIIVSDEGESFNFSEVKKNSRPYQLNESIEFMREGGLGLFLIESLMDKVEISQDNGVIVKMTKFIGREQVERDEASIST